MAPTAEQLREQAVRHVDRYRPTASQLLRVLRRRLQKHGGDLTLADRVVAGLVACGVLDDARVAADWVTSLHRRGIPARAIRTRLLQKGLAADVIAGALARLDEVPGEPDLAAAVAYARRRRLGPFRLDERELRRQRDLASMARAGFPFGICRRVVDARDVQALEDELRG